eukprot:TRINITY_DN15877_c0_g1_i1.p1 TRINITY_DN15877_c0_g1~~TRINITY_DN15877_c0_g1_i1.p1  ORF type:complete len:829 (+),score=203.17 TRINITY_DN15877_c0_g1_i1:25-2487(+)
MAEGRKCNIRVAVRVRPLSEAERASGDDLAVAISGDTLVLSEAQKQARSFQFHHCFTCAHPATHPNYTDQATLFRSIGLPIVDDVFDGYNACLFAYGMTGSGKTYTMMGDLQNEAEWGVIPRVCREIFQRAEVLRGRRACAVRVSYLEVYKEQIRDLLVPTPTPLTLGAHPLKGSMVVGLRWRDVRDYQSVLRIMQEGARHRATGATNMNEHSSRSHAVFNIHFTITADPSLPAASRDGIAFSSMLHLVDLAGSERVRESGVQGEALRETQKINQSLFVLGNVISRLAAHANGEELNLLVPYRESILTRLLRNSLGGNSRTYFVATISPAQAHVSKSLSTLQYAAKAAKIRMDVTPVVVEDVPQGFGGGGARIGDVEELEESQRLLEELRQERELERLLRHMAEAERKLPDTASQAERERREQELTEWRARYSTAADELEQTRQEVASMYEQLEENRELLLQQQLDYTAALQQREERLLALEATKDKLEYLSEQRNAELRAMDSRLNRAAQERDAAQLEAAAQAEKLRVMQDALNRTTEDKAKADAELEQTKKLLDLNEEAIKQREAALSSATESLRFLQARLIETAEEKDDLEAQMEKQGEELAAASHQLVELSNTAHELRQQFEQQRVSKLNKVAIIRDLQLELETQQALLAEQADASQQTHAELEAANAELRRALADAEADRTHLRKQLEERDARIAALERLQHDLNNSQTQHLVQQAADEVMRRLPRGTQRPDYEARNLQLESANAALRLDIRAMVSLMHGMIRDADQRATALVAPFQACVDQLNQQLQYAAEREAQGIEQRAAMERQLAALKGKT